MKSRRRRLVLFNLFILPLLLFHFQNCAAPSGSADGTPTGGQASVAENLNAKSLQFVTQSVEIQDSIASTGVDGLCGSSQEKATLGWTVWADQNASSAVAQGQSTCRGGQFQLQVNDLDQLVCGVPHLLVVQGTDGVTTSTEITRRCQPLASETAPVPQGSPMGTTCELDYTAATAAEQPCMQVCYRDNKVVFSIPQPISQCQTLAASLTGP